MLFIKIIVMSHQEKQRLLDVMCDIKDIKQNIADIYEAERLKQEYLKRLMEAPPIRVSLSPSLEYSSLVLLVLVLIMTAGVLFFVLIGLVAGRGF